MRRSLAILGAGRVGRALGRRLREEGWKIGAVVTRSAASAREINEISCPSKYALGSWCLLAILPRRLERGGLGTRERQQPHRKCRHVTYGAA